MFEIDYLNEGLLPEAVGANLFEMRLLSGYSNFFRIGPIKEIYI